jgi:hypothetical protein
VLNNNQKGRVKMKKRICLFGIVLVLGVIVGSYSSNAVEVKEKKGPMADSSKMMLEHVSMDCTICHGASGPKGVQMGNHPKEKCTDCHVQGVAKPLTHKAKRINLSREMMLKHGAALNCKICHGENGPSPMMLEHVGMDCQTCHVVEDR